MRLDLFLKASRLSPRRTVAQQLCDAGAVTVNGAVARSARAVHVGDEITVRLPRRIVTVRVLAVPTTKQTSKADVSSLYTVVREEQHVSDPFED